MKHAICTLMLVAACEPRKAKEAPQGGRDPTPQVSHREEPSDPLPGVRRELTAAIGDASRVAIGDLDGDGAHEIVIVGASRMRVLDASGRELASTAVTRGMQALAVADVEGDGPAEVIAGWGATREHRTTKAAFTLHRLRRGQLVEEAILEPGTSRQDVAAIVPGRGDRSILLAYFDSKYNVSSVIARWTQQGWDTSTVASLRMATSYAWGDVDGDGTPALVVGRVYGDAQGADGDAFVLATDGTRTRVPSTRGMRSIAAVDVDGDGRAEVLMGDGWHPHYGEHARGLLSWSRRVEGGFETELIEETSGQYAIEKIVPAKIDGRVAIVAAGNRYVRVFQRTDGRWHGFTIGGAARDVAVGELDGSPGDEILIVGDRSEVVSLQTAPTPAR